MPNHRDVQQMLLNHPKYQPVFRRAQTLCVSPSVLRRMEQAIRDAPTIASAVKAAHAVLDEKENP